MFSIDRTVANDMHEAFRENALVVVTPTRSEVEVTTDVVLTWQHFKVERWLRRTPKSAASCNDGATAPAGVLPGHFVVAIPRGTAVVDGVTIHELTFAHLQFERGQRYLFMGIECGDRFGLTYSEESVLAVSPDGRLQAPTFRPDGGPLVRDILKLGTLQRLESELERLPPS